ncbi:hypothetical protein E4U53_000485 [Claviceps sorghi]|nr:hypothetical protein E4U53_000485 [Claviceps sorghi]
MTHQAIVPLFARANISLSRRGRRYPTTAEREKSRPRRSPRQQDSLVQNGRARLRMELLNTRGLNKAAKLSDLKPDHGRVKFVRDEDRLDRPMECES